MNNELSDGQTIAMIVFGVIICVFARVYYMYGSLQPIWTFFVCMFAGALCAVVFNLIVVVCLGLIMEIGEKKIKIKTWGDELDKRIGELEKETNRLVRVISRVEDHMTVFNEDMKSLKAYNKGKEIVLEEARILAEKDRTKTAAGLS